MKDSIFEYKEYKKYVMDLIQSQRAEGRGLKRDLAEAIGCQSPFISQVLGGELQFNPDQALACAKFFGLNRDETDFFLLLISKARAASQDAKKYFQETIEAKQQAHRQIKNRMKMKESVDQENQLIYYSSWTYSAIHMALTIPELRTREALAKKFNLEVTSIDQILEFLVKAQLAEKKGTTFAPSGYWYHLEKNSPSIMKHHTNLHLKSLQSLDSPKDHDIHYSAVFSCSKEDLARLEELILKTLADFNALVRPSKEEELAAVSLNLFRV